MSLVKTYPREKPTPHARVALWKVYVTVCLLMMMIGFVLMTQLNPKGTLYLVLFRDQWAHRLSQSSTFLLWITGIALMIQQWIKNKREAQVLFFLRWLQKAQNQAWHSALIDQVMKELKSYESFLSVKIWHRALSVYIDEQLNYEQKLQIADREKELCYDKIDLTYRSVNTIIWLIPLSGFLGTVIGMSVTMGRFDQLFNVQDGEQLMQLTDLSPAVQGLATAFDTTLLALALVIPLKICTVLMQRKDDLLVQEIDDILGAGFIHTRPLLDLTAMTDQSVRIQHELTQITQSLVMLNENLTRNQWMNYTTQQQQWQSQMLQIQQQSLHHLEHIHQLTQHPLVISRVDQSK